MNLGEKGAHSIDVYPGDTPEQLAEEFSKKHGLDENTRRVLVELLS